MKFISAIAAVLLLCGVLGTATHSQSQNPATPPDLAWNRFESQNFEVLATSKEQGESLHHSLEHMRRWLYDRWGFKQGDFSVKCKVLVVHDQATYLKLFKKDKPAVRVERDKGGRIQALTIWCWAGDRWYTSTLPGFLTEVVLSEFEQAHNVKFPLWLHRGMATLNRSVPDIRQEVGSISQIYEKNLPCFWTQDIMTMTQEKLVKFQPQNQAWFDRQSAAFCLYLMKQHGRKKFLEFLDTSLRSPEKALAIIGQADYQAFDQEFNRYMYNLSREIVTNKTPNSYLTWDSH